MPQPGAAQRAGRDARPPRRQQRRERLAQQRGDLGQREHAVAGGVVDAGQVVQRRVLEHAGDVVLADELVARVEAEDRRHGGQRQQAPYGSSRDPARAPLAKRSTVTVTSGVALRERRPRRARPRRCPARSGVRGGCGRRIVLGEVRRVVALAAVEVRRGLEHELAHRRVRRRAGGEDVHRPDHVVLVRGARRRRRRSRRSGACRSPCRCPAARTIRSSSACWVPTRTYSVRVSSQVGSLRAHADDHVRRPGRARAPARAGRPSRSTGR